MKKTLRMLGLVAAAALISAPALKAETPTTYFYGVGITYANDALKQVTNTNLGLNFNAGLDREIKGTTIGFRPALAITFLPGSWDGDSKTSLTNLQASGDLVINTSIEKFKVVTGMSVNLWRYIGDARNGASNKWGLNSAMAPGGLKLGLRVGFDYKFSKQITGELLWQGVEFGNKPNDEQSWQNFNPTWLQVGVKYHF
jgi:hypothetical protein